MTDEAMRARIVLAQRVLEYDLSSEVVTVQPWRETGGDDFRIDTDPVTLVLTRESATMLVGALLNALRGPQP